MKPKAICYFVIMLLVTGMIACGGDDTEPEETQTPTTTSSEPAEPTPTVGRDIDFAAEEQAIRDLYAVYATAHGAKDEDTLTEVWLSGESKDIFTAWTFWAGTFEKNEGAKAVSKAWAGIFRLRGGKMEVDITYISIDSRGKEAVLRGAYNWGNQKGDLISVLKKDGSDWKIRAIDYTDGRFGKQVKDLIEPAHTVGEIPEE
jgi:ketosteroid isomerase-like protein